MDVDTARARPRPTDVAVARARAFIARATATQISSSRIARATPVTTLARDVYAADKRSGDRSIEGHRPVRMGERRSSRLRPGCASRRATVDASTATRAATQKRTLPARTATERVARAGRVRPTREVAWTEVARTVNMIVASKCADGSVVETEVVVRVR